MFDDTSYTKTMRACLLTALRVLLLRPKAGAEAEDEDDDEDELEEIRRDQQQEQQAGGSDKIPSNPILQYENLEAADDKKG